MDRAYVFCIALLAELENTIDAARGSRFAFTTGYLIFASGDATEFGGISYPFWFDKSTDRNEIRNELRSMRIGRSTSKFKQLRRSNIG